MFHATAMGASYDAILDPLARLFGCRVLHDNEVPTPGVERRGGMTWIADNSIEIGQPLRRQSPVRRFLDRFGGGMHSVAVQVADLDVALERAERAGVHVATRIDEGLAFTRPGDTSGLLVEWYSKRQADDPRWGAPEPPFVSGAGRAPHARRVRRRDRRRSGQHRVAPRRGARHRGDDHFGRRPGRPATRDRRARRLRARALPDPVVGAGERRRLGWQRTTARAVSRSGWWSTTSARAERALDDAGVGVHHRTSDGSVVLDPTSLPFPVVLTDHLLPGDPRTP